MAKLGGLAPDLPEWGHGGLVVAQNSYYSPAGYKPVQSPSAITSALNYNWLGGGAFSGVGGSTAMLAGTTDGLYSYSGSTWTKRYPVGAGAYTLPWNFAQFGDIVIGVSGSTAPVKYTIATTTGALLGGTPPSASMICVAFDHVFLAGNSSAISTVYSSALNNCEGWTVGTGGADSQVLPDGGEITGLAGGEFVLVFQESAISLLEKADAPIYWTRRKIAEGVGSLCAGSVVKAGQSCGFYSRDGFKLYSAGEVVPIGKDKVDLTFAAAYTEAEIKSNLRAAFDEKRGLVIWSMPDKLWVFHIDSGNWTTIYIPGLVGISTGKTVNVTLETIAVTYPAIESVPGSFDDPIWQGGQPMMLIAKTDKILYALGGSDALEATFRKVKEEILPAPTWAHVRCARVETDATSGVTVDVDVSPRLGDSYTRVSASTMRANGDLPLRASGRFVQSQIVMAEGATWSFVSGLDLDATPGGRQ